MELPETRAGHCCQCGQYETDLYYHWDEFWKVDRWACLRCLREAGIDPLEQPKDRGAAEASQDAL